jgi:hypothetical protein
VDPEAPQLNSAATAAKGVTGAQLAQDKIDRYRPLGAFGRPAYQSHVQLRAMLMAKRGPKFANYFAKPTYDADAGELRWTSEVPGAARGWHEMTPDEQAQRALDLEVVRSGLTSYVQELRAQGASQPGGSHAFASLLEQALKVPAQGDFLYFVGDQPVIAFWGFETQAGASVEPTTLAPQYPLEPLAAEPMATAAPVAIAEKRKRPWWWWLLWALLALLLLLASLFLLRACSTPPVAPVPTEDRKPPVEEVKPPVETPKPPVEEPKPPVEEAKPPVEPPKPPVEEAPPPPKPKPKPVVKPPEPPKPPVEEKPPEPPPKPPVEEAPAPPPPPKPLPERPPQTEGMSAGPHLQIPPNALEKGDLSFLEGLWQLGEGRLAEYRSRPQDTTATDRTVFGFSRDGPGRVYVVERRDARTNRPLPSMTGRLNAYTDGKRLYIDRDDGSKYECEVQRGQTQCYVVNSDGHRWNAPLRRLQ